MTPFIAAFVIGSLIGLGPGPLCIRLIISLAIGALIGWGFQ